MVKALLGQLHLPAWNSIVLIFLGAAFCFAGWKLFSSFRKVYGAMIGAALGLSLTAHEDTAWIRWVSSGLAAATGMFLTEVVYLFGLVVTGGIGLGLMTGTVLMSLTPDSMLIDVGTGVSILAGAFLAARTPEWTMMAVTSALGAMLTATGAGNLLRGPTATGPQELNLVHAGAIAAVGFLSQFVIWYFTQGTAVVSVQEDSRPLPAPPGRPEGPLNRR